jgi:hypothetical protein
MKLNPIVYFVSDKDIKHISSTWTNKVMQFPWQNKQHKFYETRNVQSKFHTYLRELKREYLKGQMTLEELNLTIYKELEIFKIKYPDLFVKDKFGYHTCEKLYELYKAGRLTIEGFSIEDELALRKQQEEEEQRRKEEKERLKQEEIRRLKESLTEIEPGMCFKSLDVLLEYLYKMNPKIERFPYLSPKKKPFVHQYLDIEYRKANKGKLWIVDEVKIPFKVYAHDIIDRVEVCQNL